MGRITSTIVGATELNISGRLADGRSGFYKCSQSNGPDSAITEAPAPAPPPTGASEPVSLALVGLGLAGRPMTRRRARRGLVDPARNGATGARLVAHPARPLQGRVIEIGVPLVRQRDEWREDATFATSRRAHRADA